MIYADYCKDSQAAPSTPLHDRHIIFRSNHGCDAVRTQRWIRINQIAANEDWPKAFQLFLLHGNSFFSHEFFNYFQIELITSSRSKLACSTASENWTECWWSKIQSIGMLQARWPHDFFFHMKTHLQLLLRYYTLYSGNYTVWIGTVSIKKIVSSEVYYTLGCDIGYNYNDVSLKFCNLKVVTEWWKALKEGYTWVVLYT